MSFLKTKQAVIFDFDGVLVDSVSVKTEAFRTLYADHAPAIQASVVNFHLENGGLSRFEKIRHYETVLLGRNPSQSDIDRLADLFARKVKDSVVAADEIPGATQLLDLLHNSTPMFVASGTPETELLEIVARRGWSDFFTEIRGSPAHKSTLLREIVARHGLEADRCVMIGDAMTDFSAARENRIPFIGISDRDNRHSFPEGTVVYDNLVPLLESLG